MHNERRENGGGVLGSAVIRNSIVFCNRSFGALEHDGAQMEYSCTRPLPAGAGNITTTPLLMADYQQMPDSPTVNAGSNAYAAGLRDLAGTNRILFGTVDMGCYECTVPEPGVLGLAVLCAIYELRLTMWGKWKGGKKERSGA